MNVDPTPEATAGGILAADACALRSIAAYMKTEADVLHKASVTRSDLVKYAGQLFRAAGTLDVAAAAIGRGTPAGSEGTIS